MLTVTWPGPAATGPEVVLLPSAGSSSYSSSPASGHSGSLRRIALAGLMSGR
ncbi:hypothetical protein [Planomonospora sphaerica]|uniref:hypothetical protein n=1 Tax=Planomonospora sphaerica TaxID=161355 RepID=UPI0012F9017E|nr:hypothetical protein [Planomonospora sphaerica]